MYINTSAIDWRDSKYIGGIQPSQLSKTMNNDTFDQMLSIDELQSINAGVKRGGCIWPPIKFPFPPIIWPKPSPTFPEIPDIDDAKR